MAVLLGWIVLIGLVVVSAALSAQALQAAYRSLELRRRRRGSRR
ncbi:MAG TPA: hypothetical protein VHV82_13365 [Sporichthyaceae bacterium]|jgi:hypothetical protein|nr:hypothetical protein [Sporichthyaceae bacterium]